LTKIALLTPITAHLLCHPATPCAAVESIELTVEPTAAGGLTLRYFVRSMPGALQMPLPSAPGPADNLWQHTCCEAFIAPVDDKQYREFNFSPSSQWAAYRFTDYRQRDTRFTPAGAPGITVQTLSDGFQLEAELSPDLLPEGKALLLCLSAVIEATEGSKSYWALAHCAAQPDFHLRQSFTLTLNRNTP